MGMAIQICRVLLGGVGGCLAAKAVGELGIDAGAGLARRIYPLSKWDRDDGCGQPHFGNSYFQPNSGVCVHIDKYNALSTTRKIVNIIAMAALGAGLGVVVGGVLGSGIVGAIMGNFPSFRATVLIATVSGGLGAIASLLHDPKLGAPLWDSLLFHG